MAAPSGVGSISVRSLKAASSPDRSPEVRRSSKVAPHSVRYMIGARPVIRSTFEDLRSIGLETPPRRPELRAATSLKDARMFRMYLCRKGSHFRCFGTPARPSPLDRIRGREVGVRSNIPRCAPCLRYPVRLTVGQRGPQCNVPSPPAPQAVPRSSRPGALQSQFFF